MCRADTAGGEKGPSFAPAELWRASGAHGIVGAMCCGISADHGSLVGLAGVAHCAEPILRAVKKDEKDIKDKKD